MLKGDITNQLAPALLVDSDLIVQTKHRFIGGTKFEPIVGASKWMNHLFSTELSIYVGAVRDKKAQAEEIQKFLDEFYIPYTRFYWLDSFRTIDEIMRMPHVHQFLISAEHPERQSTYFNGKGYVIHSLTQALGTVLT